MGSDNRKKPFYSPRKWRKLEVGHVKKVRGLTDKTLRALVNGLEKGKKFKTWSQVLTLPTWAFFTG